VQLRPVILTALAAILGMIPLAGSIFLSDSIVRALMEADGIDPQELSATLRQTGRKLVRRAGSWGQRSMPGGNCLDGCDNLITAGRAIEDGARARR
jgi:hypothetical protein